jgi:rhamnosyltransferase
VVLLVPVCNAGPNWVEWISAVQGQTLRPDQVVVLDSGSGDQTAALSRAAGFLVVPIDRQKFNHGTTRQQAVLQHAAAADFVIFMSQDAILADSHAMQQLLRAFDDPQVAASYGRQLPQPDASAIEAHARIFNYPARSRTVRLQDRATLGLKACFFSNAFAAYRVPDLLAAGGFPQGVILGEDTYLAARLLLSGKALCYAAEACVRHSHDYSAWQEFQRMFDTGVFHADNAWLRHEFGSAEGEGMRFLRSQLGYLLKRSVWRLPQALWRSALKLLAYRLGLVSRFLPLGLKRHCAMHKAYWA